MGKTKDKVGRNDPCPCGSGKKYKKCCFGKDSEARSRELKAQNELLARQPGRGYYFHEEEDEPEGFDGLYYLFEDLSDEELLDKLPTARSREHILELIQEHKLFSAQALVRLLGDLFPHEPVDETELAAATRLWMRVLPEDLPIEALGFLIGLFELRSRKGVFTDRNCADIRRVLQGLERILTRHSFTQEELLDAAYGWNPLVFLALLLQDWSSELSWDRGLIEDIFSISGAILERVSPLEKEFFIGARGIRVTMAMELGRYEVARAEMEHLITLGYAPAQLLAWADEHYLNHKDGPIPKDKDYAEHCYQLLIDQDHELAPRARIQLARLRGEPLFKGPESTGAYLEDEDMQALLQAGFELNRGLCEKILARGEEAAVLLNDLMLDTLRYVEEELDLPDDEELPAAHGPTHALVLAAELGLPAALHGALRVLDADSENEIVLYAFEALVTRLAPSCYDELIEVARDETRSIQMRECVCQGLIHAGVLNPELRAGVSRDLIALLDSYLGKPSDVADILALVLGSMGTPEASAAVKAAGTRGSISEWVSAEASRAAQAPWTSDALPHEGILDRHLKTLAQLAAEVRRS